MAGAISGHRLDTAPDCGVQSLRCRAGGISMHSRGVCERALEPRDVGEGPLGNATAANRTREIRPSGMRGGPGETRPMRNCEPSPRGPERGGVGNPPLPVRAPRLYPTTPPQPIESVTFPGSTIDIRGACRRVDRADLRRERNFRRTEARQPKPAVLSGLRTRRIRIRRPLVLRRESAGVTDQPPSQDLPRRLYRQGA